MRTRQLLKLIIAGLVIGGVMLLDTGEVAAQTFNPAPNCVVTAFETDLTTLPSELAIVDGTYNGTDGTIDGTEIELVLAVGHTFTAINSQIDFYVREDANVDFELRVDPIVVQSDTDHDYTALTPPTGYQYASTTLAEYGHTWRIKFRNNTVDSDPLQVTYILLRWIECAHSQNVDDPFDVWYCNVSPLTVGFDQSAGSNRWRGSGYGAPALQSDTRQPVAEVELAPGTSVSPVTTQGRRGLRFAGSAVEFTITFTMPTNMVSEVYYRLSSNDTSVAAEGQYYNAEDLTDGEMFSRTFAAIGTIKNFRHEIRDFTSLYIVTISADTVSGTTEVILDDLVFFVPNCVGTQLGLPMVVSDFAPINEYIDAALFDKVNISVGNLREHTPTGTNTATAFAISRDPGANVYAIAPGTVISVTALNPSTMCIVPGLTGITDGCYLYIASGDYLGRDETEDAPPLILQTFSNVNVSIVRVSYDDGQAGDVVIDYLVADEIVEVSDVLELGDQIGETIALEPLDYAEDEVVQDGYTILPNYESGWGFTQVAMDGDITGSYPDLYPAIWQAMRIPPGAAAEVGDLTRPLTHADERAVVDLHMPTETSGNFWQFLFHTPVIDAADAEDAIYAVSNQAGAFVYSGIAGEVLSVYPYTCNYIPGSTDCIGTMPGSVTGDSLVDFGIFAYDSSNLYIVSIRVSNDLELNYIVEDAINYVDPGSNINAGCIIGKTTLIRPADIGPALSWVIDVLLFELGDEVTTLIDTDWADGAGVAMMALVNNDENEFVPVINDLVDYPTEENACNGDSVGADCNVPNAQIQRSGESWETRGSVTFENTALGRAILAPGAEIFISGLPLDTEVAYGVTVGFAGEGEITIGIGQTTEEFDAIPNGEVFGEYGPGGEIQLTPAIHEPDNATLYTVRVLNSGTTELAIESVCVSDGEPAPTPGSCYFNNFGFNFGASGWVLGGGAVGSIGEILMPDQSTISQELNIPFEGEDPIEYTLTVQLLTPTGWSDEDVVYLEYSLDNGDTYNPLGPGDIEFTGLGASLENTTIEEIIEVTEPINDTFVMRVTATDGESEPQTYRVRVNSVCLGLGTGSGDSGDCEVNPLPDNEDLSAWTYWHWKNLDNFFQCELMPMLNKIYKLIKEIFTLIGWMFRYFKEVTILSYQWLGDQFLPWLGGHFANIASGRTTVITTTGTNANFWDVLVSLFNNIASVLNNLIDGLNEIVVAIVDGLVNVSTLIIEVIRYIFDLLFVLVFTIITGVLTLAYQLFNFLWSWIFGMLSSFFQLIVDFNNATPEPIPGAPLCAVDPQSNAFCVMLWAAEHTIFSGVGTLWIPLLISMGTMNLILWSIKEFKKTLEQTGQAI